MSNVARLVLQIANIPPRDVSLNLCIQRNVSAKTTYQISLVIFRFKLFLLHSGKSEKLDYIVFLYIVKKVSLFNPR